MRRLPLTLGFVLLATLAPAQESAPTRIESAPAGTSTDVPLRDYLMQRIDGEKELTAQAFVLRDQAIAAALAAAKEATLKSEEDEKARNLIQNEWRASLSDLGSTMARQDALERVETNFQAAVDRLAEDIAVLENRAAAQGGQDSGAQTTWSSQATAIGLVLLAASLIINAIVSFRRRPEGG